MKRLILIAAFLLAAALPLAAAELFYLDLMRDGIHAYDRGDFAVATRHFRLACFGMLDEPKLLGECLGRLALAQDKGKDVAGFRETFGRLVEIEERFQGYSQSSLPPEARTVLAQRMAALIPAPTLAASPQALRGGPAGPKADAQTGDKTAQTTRPPAPKPQSDKPQPIERSTAAAPSASAQPQPVPPPAPVPSPEKTGGAAAAAPAPRGPSDAEKKQLEKARRLLRETGNVRQLREAFQLAREVADAHPESRETQQLAGEAAYRISRWSDAADYLGRAGGPGENQPELLFYLAVALYESGASQAAAAPLRRALPNLQRTPYVDGYARKILGQ